MRTNGWGDHPIQQKSALCEERLALQKVLLPTNLLKNSPRSLRSSLNPQQMLTGNNNLDKKNFYRCDASKGLTRSGTRNYRIGSLGNWPLNTTERWMRAVVTQDNSQERLEKLREIR